MSTEFKAAQLLDGRRRKKCSAICPLAGANTGAKRLSEPARPFGRCKGGHYPQRLASFLFLFLLLKEVKTVILRLVPLLASV